MQIDAFHAALLAVCVLPICIFTFYMDMKHKRITNPTVWALFLLFIAVGLFTLPFTDFLWRFAGYAIVFTYGFVLWLVRQMGAGDVKFAAVAALFIHPGERRSHLLS